MKCVYKKKIILFTGGLSLLMIQINKSSTYLGESMRGHKIVLDPAFSDNTKHEMNKNKSKNVKTPFQFNHDMQA